MVGKTRDPIVVESEKVVTLARRVDEADPIAPRLAIHPLDFTGPDRLAEALSGVDTLYNTYWIRFPRGASTFERAVEQSSTLFAAARRAGVRRLVHVSVVNADPPFHPLHGRSSP